MMGLRLKDKETIANRFGCSMRLAVRVTALLARKIDITETVLSTASSDETLEKTLLDPLLIAGEQPLDEKRLHETARKYGYREAALLKIAEHENGWQTIALKDDLLAAEENDLEAPGAGGALTLTDFPRQVALQDKEYDLFSPQDIAKLKLQALTSQNTGERVEAIRKLAYAPGPDTATAGLLVRILNDITADRTVRREVLVALEEIGLDPDLVDPLFHIFDTDEDAALSALRRLASAMDRVQDTQKSVVLAVLLEVLDRSDSTAVIAETMTVIAVNADILSRSEDRLSHFLRLAVQHLSEKFSNIHRAVAQAFDACHHVTPAAVEDNMWKELGSTTDPHVKGFLIRQIARLCEDGNLLKQLAETAVEEYISQDLTEEQRSYLKYALIITGEPAAIAVAEKLAHTSGQTRSELVALLDTLCRECEVSDETLRLAVVTVLKLLKVARHKVRQRVLEATFFTSVRIEADLKSEVAAELLSHIPEFQMSNTREDICHSLQRLGPPAVVPILDYLQRHIEGDEADGIFIALGRIAEEAGKNLDDCVAHEAISFCGKLLAEEGGKRGKFCIALAWLCGYSRAGKEHIDATVKRLQKKAWKSKYTFEIIEALGILAGSPNMTVQHQRKIFEMFSHIASLQTEAALGIEKEGESGPVFEFGRGIHFETIVIPAVVRGLERIGIGMQTPDKLRSEVVKRLLVLWEGVSHMRLVWSPAAVEALVNAMGAVASSGRTNSDMRARLGKAMLNSINKTSVIINLGRICAIPDKDRRMRELSMSATDALLAEWKKAYSEDFERRTSILKSLGMIASNNALDQEDSRVKALREIVIETLFQGLRAGFFQVKESLMLLRDCNGLTDRQRSEIDTRLQQAFGLVARSKENGNR